MNLLAFETSSPQLSVALCRDDRVWSRVWLDAGGGSANSERALPMMHALLAEAGMTLPQLDAIVFGQGPGAFTGVRVACGVTQGLAFGLNVPVVGLPTTLALAHAADASYVLVAIDARMNEIYAAAYEKSETSANGWRELIPPILTNVAALTVELGAMRHDWVGIGSAFNAAPLGEELRNMFSTISGRPAVVHGDVYPTASALIALVSRIGLTHATPAAEAAPLYLRNQVALTIAERAAKKALAAEAAS